MKTQVIQLEEHDDVISIRDRMNWGKTSRLLLVWPEKGSILTRKLDLLLLQRHSYSLSSQLAIITNDLSAITFARELSISVFSSIAEAQNAVWKRPKKRNKISIKVEKPVHDFRNALKSTSRDHPSWMDVGWVRFLFFVVGVSAVIVMGFFFYPSSKITLIPATVEQVITFTMSGNPTTTKVNISGFVPEKFLSTIVSGESQINTSGSYKIPVQNAKGVVSFTNLTNQVVEIPLGSIVLFSGNTSQKYMTIQKGLVDAGPGKYADIPVEAMLPGINGNLPANQINAVEGDLGLEIAVSNPQPIQGGSSQFSSAPSPADREVLKNNLESKLRSQAIEVIRRQLNPQDILLEETIKLTRVVDSVYQPTGDQPADTLSLKLEEEYGIYYVDWNDVVTASTEVLDANIKKDYAPVPNTLVVKLINGSADSANQIAKWTVQAKRELLPIIDDSQIIQNIAGRRQADAIQELKNMLPLKEPPMIGIDPTWWHRLPYLPFRISLKYQ